MDAKVQKWFNKLAIRKFSDPWANLAAAVLHSGIAAHDELFLKSKWAETLSDICDLANLAEDARRSKGVGLLHGSVNKNKSNPKGGAE